MANIHVNAVSCIAAGTRFVGDYATQDDLRIDGTFEGKLYCGGLLEVGESGVVKGTIVGNNIQFSGTMSGGSFYAKDTLTLKNGSKVGGDIYSSRLQIDLGAQFVGNCKLMDGDKFEKAAAPLMGMLQAVPKVETPAVEEKAPFYSAGPAPESVVKEEVPEPEVPAVEPLAAVAQNEKPAAKGEKSALDSMAESWLGWQKRSR